MDIQTLIGMGAAPLVIIALTAHIRSFSRAVHAYVMAFATRNYTLSAKGTSDDPSASVWPLVADLVAVAWCLGLAQGGQLQAFLHLEHVQPATVILVGLALGIASGQIRDKVTSATAPATAVTLTVTPPAG